MVEKKRINMNVKIYYIMNFLNQDQAIIIIEIIKPYNAIHSAKIIIIIIMTNMDPVWA